MIFSMPITNLNFFLFNQGLKSPRSYINLREILITIFIINNVMDLVQFLMISFFI